MTSKLAMRMHTIGFERRRRLKPILCAKSIIATVKFRLFLESGAFFKMSTDALPHCRLIIMLLLARIWRSIIWPRR